MFPVDFGRLWARIKLKWRDWHRVSEYAHPNYRLHKILNLLYRRFGAGWLAKWLRKLFAVTFIASASFLTLLEFTEPSSALPAVIKPLIEGIHENRFTIAVALLMTQGLSGLSAWVLRRLDEWATPEVEKLKSVLSSIVEFTFENRNPDHVYRATLFREHGCWGFGGWLGIVARAPETYAGSNTIFSVSLKHHKHCTGIAGECWWRAKSMQGGEFVTVLPDCRRDVTLEGAYNASGNLSQNEFAQIQVKSCVFRAVAIRRQGKVWGVLVIDCTDPSEAPDAERVRPQDRRKRDLLEHAAKSINLLIE